jgi:hypothetical protein
MSVGVFNRDDMARWYAKRHLKTDPGIRVVYYLPAGAPEREIRFVEINEAIANRDEDPIEPIDFGVDTSGETAHRLVILDITPAQWEKLNKGDLQLPPSWSLSEAIDFPRD